MTHDNTPGLPNGRNNGSTSCGRSTGTPRLVLLAALLLSLEPLAAQTLPIQLPSGAEPGREVPQPVLPMRTEPGGQIVVPAGTGGSVAPAGAENIRFTLHDVTIEGASAYPADALRPLYADRVGKEITVADAFKVANDIELKYRNAGYVTTRAIIPEQTIADGNLRIVVVEGFVSDIVYEDSIGPARAAVSKLLEPLRGVKPITVAAIERRLLLANDLPGLTVRATLEPSPETQGGSVIVVRSVRKAIDAQLAYSNRASPYLGTNDLLGTIAFNSIGARADRLSLSAKVNTPVSRSSYLAANYDALVSDNGLTLGLSTAYAKSNPGRELAPLDVKSKVASNMATLTYPLIRSRLQNLRLVGQFEVRDVDTDISGIGFTRDKLRILRAGVSYDRTDDWNGITALRGTLHKGLDAFGASKQGDALASRANGRSDFFKVTADASRLQQISPRFSVFATMTSQFSNNALLASEELALGGSAFLRGYDAGEVAADNGVAASIEVRYVPSLPKLLPNGGQIYGFVDGGHLWAHSGGAVPDHANLASFGGGMRANLNRFLFATLEVAKPVNQPVRTRGDKNPRIFLTLTAQY